ncbi:MAG: type toxin-antitoxin system ParD family antitoxin [Rhizobium sp.]|nr:type toxin-antitoxin system ParD family antitoxin [Rhizobium sp.]
MQSAEKISITMTPEMLRVIRESVDAGEYASTSEVIRDAMRLWQRQREEHAETIKSIKARIRRSLDDPRPDLTGEEVDAHMKDFIARANKEFKDASS